MNLLQNVCSYIKKRAYAFNCLAVLKCTIYVIDLVAVPRVLAQWSVGVKVTTLEVFTGLIIQFELSDLLSD